MGQCCERQSRHMETIRADFHLRKTMRFTKPILLLALLGTAFTAYATPFNTVFGFVDAGSETVQVLNASNVDAGNVGVQGSMYFAGQVHADAGIEYGAAVKSCLYDGTTALGVGWGVLTFGEVCSTVGNSGAYNASSSVSGDSSSRTDLNVPSGGTIHLKIAG